MHCKSYILHEITYNNVNIINILPFQLEKKYSDAILQVLFYIPMHCAFNIEKISLLVHAFWPMYVYNLQSHEYHHVHRSRLMSTISTNVDTIT